MEFQYITPSEVIEYLFCPRFLYYMCVLKVDQHEHRRKLVNKGRDIHNLKLVQNKEYLRSKIGVTEKHADVYLSSESLKLVGKIDEVLILNDGTAAPLDYKYAVWENKVFKTHFTQQCLYALLIEANFNLPVNKGFLVYIRSKNHLEELSISEPAKDKTKRYLDEIFSIINLAMYPKAVRNKAKCDDCTYRNLCVP